MEEMEPMEDEVHEVEEEEAAAEGIAVAVVGGFHHPQLADEVDGSASLTAPSPSTRSPSARSGHTFIALPTADAPILLFGGTSTQSGLLHDLWAYHTGLCQAKTKRTASTPLDAQTKRAAPLNTQGCWQQLSVGPQLLVRGRESPSLDTPALGSFSGSSFGASRWCAPTHLPGCRPPRQLAF